MFNKQFGDELSPLHFRFQAVIGGFAKVSGCLKRLLSNGRLGAVAFGLCSRKASAISNASSPKGRDYMVFAFGCNILGYG